MTSLIVLTVCSQIKVFVLAPPLGPEALPADTKVVHTSYPPDLYKNITFSESFPECSFKIITILLLPPNILFALPPRLFRLLHPYLGNDILESNPVLPSFLPSLPRSSYLKSTHHSPLPFPCFTVLQAPITIHHYWFISKFLKGLTFLGFTHYCPTCLEQCLSLTTFSRTICWVNERMNEGFLPPPSPLCAPKASMTCIQGVLPTLKVVFPKGTGF